MEKIIREKEVKEITGLSRVTLWRWSSSGNFPKPIRLGENSKGWLSSEVQEWIAERTKSSRKEVGE